MTTSSPSGMPNVGTMLVPIWYLFIYSGFQAVFLNSGLHGPLKDHHSVGMERRMNISDHRHHPLQLEHLCHYLLYTVYCCLKENQSQSRLVNTFFVVLLRRLAQETVFLIA